MGVCDSPAMRDGVKLHCKMVQDAMQRNTEAGVMDRYDDEMADGKPKNESNTRTLEPIPVKWKQRGVHKAYRKRPYVNKAMLQKGNMRNVMMLVTNAKDKTKKHTPNRCHERYSTTGKEHCNAFSDVFNIINFKI